MEIADAAERAEELIERVAQGHEILFCRDGNPVAEMSPVTKGTDLWDELWALMAADRDHVPAGTTSNHDEFYDEHGLPK
ncbi:hypothetical protein ASG68_23995 [Rhizobium sp. Leaf453]|nr:hypothetical protein ASG42_26565 [Rhizobium sp. Leaf391]KQU08154.1 hypothetical protein ASG68_23995 [Rhizobium sp. Leaf453]